jgi:hypothetical protein
MNNWLLRHIHTYDSYSVRATQCDDIRENVHAYCTVWLHRAVVYYVYLNFKYRNCTIVFTHHRYER